MKKKFLMITGATLVFFTSCNNSSEPAAAVQDTMTTIVKDTVTHVVTDTVTKVVEVPAAIDSAAITAAYLKAQNKTKKAPASKPKKQGDNEVSIYSETPIPTHEALEQAEPTPSPAASPAAPKVIIIHDKEYVYFTPAEKAKFPGGDPAFNAYVQKSVRYPDEALKYHVEGTVYAEVSLDSLGYVTKVDFPGKKLGSGLEEETKRIMKNCPRWMPAREAGKTVKSKITVPVTYKIAR